MEPRTTELEEGIAQPDEARMTRRGGTGDERGGDIRQALTADDITAIRRAVQKLVGERYRIESTAGSGGMSWVFEATDTVLQRRVAIKVLRESKHNEPTQQKVDAGTRKRILAEARAMAGLRSPNICPVYEVSVDGELPFIVMQWIDGLDLSAAWRSTDLNRRLSLFVKVVEAVGSAHDAGIIHGDLKPSNILVDRSGEPIIVDFGLARSRSDSFTRQRMWGGTPGFAAPEQFDGEEPIGPAADVYALGAMMYEMLADRLPFLASTAEQALKLAREQDPPLPETYAPDAPWPLQRICLAALERDIQRRYVNAHAMALDLQRYLRGETVVARPSMLAEQFTEKIEEHIDQVDAWLRQGMVTEGEANKLVRVLGGVLRPESHWILDSRRLTLSQVTLYLGGWFALCALIIGLSMTSDLEGMFRSDSLERWPAVRYITAWTAVCGFLAAGFILQRRGDRRVSLGYQVTACLAVPVAIWLLFRETEWLIQPMMSEIVVQLPGGDTQYESVNREWLYVFAGLRAPAELCLMNRQLLTIMFSWLIVSLALRSISSSSGFTLFAVIAGNLSAIAAWASAGMLSSEHHSYALLGLWMFAIGLGTIPAGLIMNRREEERARQHGRIRTRTRDSWAVLTAALLMIGIGLTLMAWNAAHVYTLGLLSDTEDPTTRATAFIINGVVLQLVSHVLSRRRTVVRSRLAEVIRWISPSHFLAGLWQIQVEAGDGLWLLWLIILAVTSISLCYISVRKQWRPFLFTGLFYVAVAYVRCFMEADSRLDDDRVFDMSRLLLTGLMLALGIATMIVAWRLPAWIAVLKLDRWSGR